jgi:hypothetical protein
MVVLHVPALHARRRFQQIFDAGCHARGTGI